MWACREDKWFNVLPGGRICVFTYLGVRTAPWLLVLYIVACFGGLVLLGTR